jgi:hypothetical protein
MRRRLCLIASIICRIIYDPCSYSSISAYLSLYMCILDECRYTHIGLDA